MPKNMTEQDLETLRNTKRKTIWKPKPPFDPDRRNVVYSVGFLSVHATSLGNYLRRDKPPFSVEMRK